MDRKAAPKSKTARAPEARRPPPVEAPKPPPRAEPARPAPAAPPRAMSAPPPPFRKPEPAPARPAKAAPRIEMHSGEEEHGPFPRALMALRFELWREQDGHRQFSATLTSTTVSVSGAFLESTFFLPVGTELRVRFALDEGAEPVEARAVIVREQRAEGRSGFGVRFVEFYRQSDVALAKLFLGVRLRTFAEEYLQSRRARSLGSELDRVVDALTAWELLKATSTGNDPWGAA
jgi:hypothetical protein